MINPNLPQVWRTPQGDILLDIVDDDNVRHLLKIGDHAALNLRLGLEAVQEVEEEIGTSTLARDLIAERLRTLRQNELRQAASALGRWLTETPEGCEMQADTDAASRNAFEGLA